MPCRFLARQSSKGIHPDITGLKKTNNNLYMTKSLNACKTI